MERRLAGAAGTDPLVVMASGGAVIGAGEWGGGGEGGRGWAQRSITSSGAPPKEGRYDDLIKHVRHVWTPPLTRQYNKLKGTGLLCF